MLKKIFYLSYFFIPTNIFWFFSKKIVVMRAGESYEKAAECNKGASNEIEGNTNYREAGKCFRHVDS